MRVACDNCGASYKIPDAKLTKEVNKATCRKCGHAMYIRRPDAPPEPQAEVVAPAEESTLISNPYAAAEAAADRPTSVTPGAPSKPELAKPSLPAALPPSPSPATRTWDLPPLPVHPEPTAPEGAVPAPIFVRAHDPRGDLAFALIGATLGVVGLLMLVAAPVLPVLGAAGAFLGLLGMLVTVLVLVTGGRGTKPASWGVAIGGAFVVSLAGGVAATSIQPRAPVTTMAAVEPTPEPVAPAEPTATPEPVATPEPAAMPEAVATREPATTSASAPQATPAPEERIAPPAPKAPAEDSRTAKSTRPERTESKPAPTPAPTPTATPAPTASEGSPGVALAAIDVMLRNNKSVIGCFKAARAETGDVPRGVKLKITMQPSGAVTGASIPSGDWAGTGFEDCVVGAVRGIDFPPFEGKTTTFTYAFPTK